MFRQAEDFPSKETISGSEDEILPVVVGFELAEISFVFGQKSMEKYLREHFDVEPKRPSEEARRRWRSAVSVVKNPRRRFRMVADLAKRSEAERKRRKIQVCSVFVCARFLVVDKYSHFAVAFVFPDFVD